MDTSPGPRDYAVQRALARGWQTLRIAPRREDAQTFFAEAVRRRPRAVLRLIQVDHRPGSTAGEFDWRLVELHDPRRLGLAPDLSPDPLPGPAPGPASAEGAAPGPPAGSRPGPPRPGRRARGGPGERVRAPLRLYALFFCLGVALVVAGWLLVGRAAPGGP
jgi:hypothetical protein